MRIYSSTVAMAWCQIHSNSASAGEALAVDGDAATVTLECSTVSGSVEGTVLQQCTLPQPPAQPPPLPPAVSCGPSTTLNAATSQCEIACPDGSEGRRMGDDMAAGPLPPSAPLHKTLLDRVQLLLDHAKLVTLQMTKDQLEGLAVTMDALLDQPHFGRPTFV